MPRREARRLADARYPVQLNASLSIRLRSNDIPPVIVEGRTAGANLIMLDPSPIRHVMPSFVGEEQIVISVPEAAGLAHDYTFSIQPNDVALRAFRAHCFGD